MDTLRLRIMTEKSIIGFGQYTDLSVQNLLNLKRTRDLRWIYYNCSMLSFKENILDQIGISKENYIEKPGKNPELCKTLNEEKRIRIPALNAFKQRMHTKKVLKSRITYDTKKENLKYSKASLQSFNHGHKSI